jgi:hypothetical protein
LETTFAIKEDFSKNDATNWAVQELKHHGLKRMFKLVASTTYERLVWSFYENLKYDCTRPSILFSLTDDENVEVTIANIVAALKCHAEPPEEEEPWIVCPSMLTTEDIVSDMYGAICRQAQECHQQGEDASTTLVCGRHAAKERVSLRT